MSSRTKRHRPRRKSTYVKVQEQNQRSLIPGVCEKLTLSTSDVAFKTSQPTSNELMFRGKTLKVENTVGDQAVKEAQVKTKPVMKQLHNRPIPRFVSLFNLLPNETLAHILSYLNIRERISVEAVCKRWRFIGNTMLCSPTKLVLDHASPETFKQNPSLTDEELGKILSRCGKFLKHLTLAKYDGFTKKVVGLIGKHCPNLLELKLCRLPLWGVYLQQLAKGCPNLKSITIQEANTLRDDTLCKFLKQFSNLECFELSKEGSSSLKNGEFCLGLSKNLRIFRAIECRYLYPNVVLIHVMSQCDSLNEFCISFAWGNFYFGWEKLNFALLERECYLDDALMTAFFENFKNNFKKVVRLYGIFCPQSLDWWHSVCLLHNLEELSLEASRYVNNRFFKCLAEHCVKLKILDVTSVRFVSDECLVSLASLPCLSVLNISCSMLDGSGLEVLAVHGRLEEVYVRGCFCLKEESLCILAKSCPRLRLLDASGVKTVSQRLVNTFWQRVKAGFLMSPVKLVVAETSVIYSEYKYEGLEVSFKNPINANKCYADMRKLSNANVWQR